MAAVVVLGHDHIEGVADPTTPLGMTLAERRIPVSELQIGDVFWWPRWQSEVEVAAIDENLFSNTRRITLVDHREPLELSVTWEVTLVAQQEPPT